MNLDNINPIFHSAFNALEPIDYVVIVEGEMLSDQNGEPLLFTWDEARNTAKQYEGKVVKI